MAKRKSKSKQNVLLVVDGLNYLHRGFWAINYKMTNQDGNPTSAIRGFISIILADLVHIGATHCAVVFDRPGKNFRHRLYPDYKGTRQEDEQTKELHAQIYPLKKLLNAMGIKVYGIPCKEGDDLIGSLAVTCSEDDPDAQVYIGSRDKDFASLVTDRIHLLHPQKEILDADGVFEKWGVPPSKMVEYLMLLGDGVDNIPGVHKIGPKTAAKILNTHGSIKKWLPTKKTPAMHKNVEAVRDFFPMSKKLITIRTDFFPRMRLDKVAIKPYDDEALDRICTDLDFRSTYKQIKTMLDKLR